MGQTADANWLVQVGTSGIRKSPKTGKWGSSPCPPQNGGEKGEKVGVCFPMGKGNETWERQNPRLHIRQRGGARGIGQGAKSM